jgi:hypothetical protein
MWLPVAKWRSGPAGLAMAIRAAGVAAGTVGLTVIVALDQRIGGPNREQCEGHCDLRRRADANARQKPQKLDSPSHDRGGRWSGRAPLSELERTPALRVA